MMSISTYHIGNSHYPILQIGTLRNTEIRQPAKVLQTGSSKAGI